MELTNVERAQLASYINTEGFKIMCSIMRDEVLRFNSELLAVEDPKEVLIKHNLASAAAKFYESMLNRVNNEVYTYTGTPKQGDKPIDVTEGFLGEEND